MNKKGFAISTMLYGLIFVTLAVFYLILSVSLGRQQSNTNFSTETRSQLQSVSETGATLKLGNYFYLTPDVTEFSISKGLTGYTSSPDQAITPSELNLWRVINILDDGSVDAVSEYVSSSEIYFSGVAGYQYFVSTLESLASSYAKIDYTIGTRMMGYDGQTKTITYSTAFNGSTNTAPTTTSTSFPTTGTGQEYLGGVGGDTLYLKDYLLVSNVYKSDTTTYGTTGLKAYKVGTTTYTAYWLASRRFFFYSASRFDFTGRCVDTGGDLWHDYFRYFSDGWRGSSGGNSLRPIITLKSGITISGGSGTKADPYTLS